MGKVYHNEEGQKILKQKKLLHSKTFHPSKPKYHLQFTTSTTSINNNINNDNDNKARTSNIHQGPYV